MKDIADQLASTINCPSFASSRAKGINLSPGTSCASAVGRALIDLNKEFQVMFKAMKQVEEDMEEDDEESFTQEELEFLKEYGEIDFVKTYRKCPQCGKTIAHSGGCVICLNGCGWSKCE